MNAEKENELRQKITTGIKAAVAAALEEHRRAGRKVAIWRDGRVQLVSPEIPEPADMALRDEPPKRKAVKRQ